MSKGGAQFYVTFEQSGLNNIEKMFIQYFAAKFGKHCHNFSRAIDDYCGKVAKTFSKYPATVDGKHIRNIFEAVIIAFPVFSNH